MKKKTILNILIILILALGGYYLVYFFRNSGTIVSQKIRNYIRAEAGDLVSYDTLSAALSGNLLAKDLLVKDLKNDTMCIVGSLITDLQTVGLLYSNLHIDAIEIKDANIKLIRSKKDSLFNYEQVLSVFSDTTETDTSTSDGWNYEISRLVMYNCNYTYHDSLKHLFMDVSIGTLELVFDNLSINSLMKLDGKEFHEIFMSIIKSISWSGKINIKAANKLNLSQIYIENTTVTYTGISILGGVTVSINKFVDDNIEKE